MKTCVLAVGVLVAVSASPALAQTGNGAPSGGHYSLNIIGVKNPKTANLTGSQRHTIFVALGKTETVKSNIYLEPGPEFRVCDGNAFDVAHNCDGVATTKTGAVFQLPCNTNLESGGVDPDGEPIEVLPCEEEDPQLAYEVWARALGKPGGSAIITTCADEVTDVDSDGVLEHVCSTENVVLVRDPGRSRFVEVTQALTSLVACFDVDPTADEDIDCFRYALFRDEFEDWVWEYDNSGLKLAQIRFYPIEED